MKKEEVETMKISIYWWNFGKKTLDFRGVYKDYLLKIGVSIEDIVHPIQNDVTGWRFTVSMSSTTITLDKYGIDYIQACDDIIKTYLLLMGDRTKFITPRQEFNINW